MAARSMFRKVGVLSGLVGVGVTTAIVYDEGANRAARFWSCALPIFAHYKWTEWFTKGKPDSEVTESFKVLHDRYAPITRDLVLDLRGFFIKLAQLGSTRDDFVPPQYMHFFKVVQDQVPPAIPAENVSAVVAAALGQPLDSVFDSFDTTPFASATIGQVHKASLKDGRDVAVKIQYPDAEVRFRADINLVINFCRLAMPQHVGALTEFRNQFESEFDYREEAEFIEEINGNITPHFGDRVKLPLPVKQFSSKSVLVMELLKGQKLDTAIKEQYTRIAAARGQTLEELQEETRNITFSERKRMLWWANLRSNAYNCLNFMLSLYNHTLGKFFWRSTYLKCENLIDIDELLELLLRVHGHQLFVDGLFNADPHPGNILLCDDGRLGLVDFGQVGRLDMESKRTFARFMLALAADDRETVVKILCEDMEYKFKYNNPDTVFRYAKFYNDSDGLDVTHGMNPMQFMGWLDEQDPLRSMNPNWVLCGRLSLVLRGFGNAFNIPLSIANAWREEAEAAVAT